MSEEIPAGTIDYQSLMKDALRGVVRDVLRHVADEGLDGEHHFYVGFRTSDDGISMPRQLRTRYPKEMTIVLQHQFWDLDVGDDAFSVTLRFGGRPGRLTIPFTAMTSFVDPSVPFGLRFDFDELGDETADRPRVAGNREETENGVPSPESAGAAAASPVRRHGEVVSIDKFRKRD